MKNRNAALDRDSEVWAQRGPVDYNTLTVERGPIETVHPNTEMYRPAR